VVEVVPRFCHLVIEPGIQSRWRQFTVYATFTRRTRSTTHTAHGQRTFSCEARAAASWRRRLKITGADIAAPAPAAAARKRPTYGPTRPGWCGNQPTTPTGSGLRFSSRSSESG
jgi:hypothetical protein